MDRKRWWTCAVGAMLFVVNLQAGGCSKFPGTANDVDFTWESDPKSPRVGPNMFTIKLNGPHGEKLVGARVSLEGHMSHPGMSPAFAEAIEVAPGQYRGTLDLKMRGDWIVLFHITLTSGRTFDRQAKIQAN
jgi:YtkA-like